ncbi:MAG: hypothetical protein ACYSWQ_07315 [Planctomycetota bacterium]|jgi:hypothetical protein
MMFQKCENRTGVLSLSGLALFIGIFLVLNGCAKQLTPYGRARQADTIEAYEEFVRTNPHDPRVRFARDRIEVLRSLEAYRSGTVPMAASSQGAPEQRLTNRGEPASVRHGPWNLTGVPPRSSTFILDLEDGCVVPTPHQLRIDQEGERVTYTLQYSSGPDGYYLTAGLPFASFRRLWATVVASDVGLFESSYGRMVSTADYRGNLVIEVYTGAERLSRTIRLEGLNVEDGNLRNLLKSMAEMHPKDHSMNFLR